MQGLYVHIPFCLKKCKYCSFFSLTGDIPEKKYADALIKHLEFIVEKFNYPEEFETLYFGGGTPSLMSLNFFSDFLVKLNRFMNIDKFKEITIEANPETLTEEYLKGLRQLGFNRISIGLQSTDNEILKKLGRIHNAEKGFKAIENALSVFENVSVDFIIGIKGQENKSPEEIFNFPFFNELKHISVYMLEGEKNEFLKCNDDIAAKMYVDVCDYLKNCGFSRYEISNFAKKGYESLHNTTYWKGHPYLGLGVSAHSFCFENDGGVRFAEKSSFKDFLNGKFKIETFYLKQEDLIREFFMLGLRMAKGVNIKEFSRKWNVDVLKYFDKIFKEFSDFFNFSKGYVCLNTEGILVSNEIFEEILFF